jgi:uncharacterized protein YuzE
MVDTWPDPPPGGYQRGAVRVDLDDTVGAAYVQISDQPVVRTVERHRDRILIDLDAEGNTVGVELLLDSPKVQCGSHRQWRLRRRRWFR